MATIRNYDDTAISTGIAVGDIFADLETSMIANRKALFKHAREQPDFKTAVYSRFEAHNKANSLAAYNALSAAKKVAYEEVTKAHNKGIWLTDKAVEHYKRQGFKGEAKENDFDPYLFMALYAMGNSLATLTNYAINSADKQVIQITGGINTNTADISQEIDSVQDIFLKGGIKGAVAYDGNEIGMSAKGEFLLRNGTRDALLDAEGQRQADYGINLIQISAHPSSCPLCIPWQSRILVNDLFGLGKPDGKHALASEAKEAGLFHYGCRHTYIVYLDGYSKPDFFERDKRNAKETADIYASEQMQRSNERMIRQWKNIEAGAMTEQKRLQAEMKVKEWQARQRILKVLTEKKGLPFYRQYAREQIGGATRPTLPSFLR